MVVINHKYDDEIVCFISDKQRKHLRYTFGYSEISTRQNVIYGAFDGDRFIWCDHNPTWLCDTFKIDCSTIPDLSSITWRGEIPVLPIPEHVDIDCELIDDVE